MSTRSSKRKESAPEAAEVAETAEVIAEVVKNEPDDTETTNKRQKTDEAHTEQVQEALTNAAIAAAATAVEADQDAVEEDSKLPGKLPPKPTPHNSRMLDINFPPHLDYNDWNHFDSFLFQLLAFRAAKNNFHVNKEENPALHAWLQLLKREYKNHNSGEESQLSATQISVLESLHVPLTSRGDDHWNRFYDLLAKYRQVHGHVLVPRLCEVPGLGDWVTDQRRQFKAKSQGQPTQLTDGRKQKLDQLDFAWKVRNRPEWDGRYQELQEYKELHGDCKVPQHYKPNKALGKWVAKQREQYKLMQKGQHSFLTPYRLEKLNDCGFVWQVRTAIDDSGSGIPESPVDGKPEQAAIPVDATMHERVVVDEITKDQTECV